MPRYRWVVEFDADNDKEADEQVGEALEAFESYHRDELEEVDEDGAKRRSG